MEIIHRNQMNSLVKETPQGVEAIIESGNDPWFHYRGKDYFIERSDDGYLIQNPMIDWDDPYGDTACNYQDYPENKVAQTPDALKALKFLDNRTIFEAFDELLFFDH
jgi:hypothetical protein